MELSLLIEVYVWLRYYVRLDKHARIYMYVHVYTHPTLNAKRIRIVDYIIGFKVYGTYNSCMNGGMVDLLNAPQYHISTVASRFSTMLGDEKHVCPYDMITVNVSDTRYRDIRLTSTKPTCTLQYLHVYRNLSDSDNIGPD